MSTIFISYADEDFEKARCIAQALEDRGRTVFYDRTIPVGSDWAAVLEHELVSCECMIVLWSRHSVGSLWVRAEAGEGFERDILIPVRLDDAPLPRLFGGVQTAPLTDWKGDCSTDIGWLLDQVEERIGTPAFRGLQPVSDDGPVSPENLTLIHSSWRRKDMDAEYPGRRMYQIHVILYGREEALRRVEVVTYRLSGYPPERREQPGGKLERNFELKELAWGWSLLRADVTIKHQPRNYPNPIRLYRFINLTEASPRLADQFMRGIRRAVL